MHDIVHRAHFSCSIFGTTTAVDVVVVVIVVVVVLKLTHRYNAVRGQGQAPITVFFLLCPICTEYYEASKAWMKHMLSARRSDMPPLRTFGFLERRALAPQAETSLSTKHSVPPFVNVFFWGVYPFLSSAQLETTSCGPYLHSSLACDNPWCGQPIGYRHLFLSAN